MAPRLRLLLFIASVAVMASSVLAARSVVSTNSKMAKTDSGCHPKDMVYQLWSMCSDRDCRWKEVRCGNSVLSMDSQYIGWEGRNTLIELIRQTYERAARWREETRPVCGHRCEPVTVKWWEAPQKMGVSLYADHSSNQQGHMTVQFSSNGAAQVGCEVTKAVLSGALGGLGTIGSVVSPAASWIDCGGGERRANGTKADYADLWDQPFFDRDISSVNNVTQSVTIDPLSGV
ncbi:hypothetical protein HK102_003840 [Quaeritorhiza haematococci]|nr:hypothetical protein HK102_003840 [Quaeritorhiza haematococci]